MPTRSLVLYGVIVSLALHPACRCGGNTPGNDTDTSDGDDISDDMTPVMGGGVSVRSLMNPAGSDQTLCPGASASLGIAAASGMTYAWAPATGLDDATHAQPVFTAASAGTFLFTLTVTDESGESASDEVTLTVEPSCTTGATPLLTLNAATTSLAEPNGSATIEFTLDATATADVVISFTFGGTAGASDYTASAQSVTIPAGQTHASITITVTDDALDEDAETLDITLGTPSGAALGNTTSLSFSIADDDAEPILSVGDQAALEDSGELTFAVTLSAASGREVRVDYATSDATTSASDHGAATGTLVFAPGETSKDIVVQPVLDTIDESDEALTLTLSNAVNAGLGDITATGTILDDDGEPVISIGDADLSEGQSGASDALFAVTLSNPSSVDLLVSYIINDGSASAADGDFDPAGASTPLLIPAGASGAVIAVPVFGDSKYEADETFTLTLLPPSLATLGDDTGAGLIDNDDQAPTLNVEAAQASETHSGATTFTFVVTPSAVTGLPIDFNWETTDTGATAGVDYVGQSASAQIPAGASSYNLEVTVNGDTDFETNETFSVTLSGGGGYTAAGSTLQATGTIDNDDSEPTLTIADVTVAEGNSGTSNAVFNVTLSNKSYLSVGFTYSVGGGNASAANDYGTPAPSSPLSIPPGDTGITITVPIMGDTTTEGDETFAVTLDDPSNASIADGSATGTILDDEDWPEADIDDADIVEGDSGETELIFTVSLSNPSSVDLYIPYTIEDGTAKAGDGDFGLGDPPTPLLIPAGQTSGTITLPVFGDTKYEADETFTVTLGASFDVTVDDGIGEGTIENDDDPPTLTLAGVSANETDGGTTIFSFTLSPSEPSGQPMTFDWTTNDGNALAGSDYDAASGTNVVIPADTSSYELQVSVTGDTDYEPDESFSVIVSGGGGYTALGSSLQANGSIQNDDDEPTISISNVSVAEGNSGTSAAVFNVTLSNKSYLDVGVTYTLVAGTATAGDDYGAATPASPLIIPAGTVDVTISVDVNGDVLNESDETFTVELSLPDNASIADDSGTGTILDDDVGLVSATTIDADGNGRIDHYRLEFEAAVSDATFPGYMENAFGSTQSQWLVGGYGNVVLAHGSAAPAGFDDTTNDEVLFLRFTEGSDPDTASRPQVTTQGAPGLQSGAHEVLPVVAVTVAESDGARPVLMHAVGNTGGDDLTLIFSEPVQSSASALCTGTLDVSADLDWNNASGGGAVDITDVGALDLNGCDGEVTIKTTSNITAGDLFTDSVRAVANQIFDIAGNSATLTAQLLSGVVKPFVLSVAPRTATRVRVIYSENVDATAALAGSYVMSVVSGTGCGTLGISQVTPISADTYELWTDPQTDTCTYKIEVIGDVRDVDDNAALVAPKFGTFLGDQQLRLLQARALSNTSVLVTFSKDLSAADAGNAGLFILSLPLGNVVTAKRYDEDTMNLADANKVLLTHSVAQGRQFYTVIGSTSIRTEDLTETLSPPPFDRTTFEGFDGAVTKVEDGALFDDPFGDGTAFAFTFAYGGQIYVGPNDTTSGAFRMNPDGTAAIVAGFRTTSSTGTFSTFGRNLRRPARRIEATASTIRYYVTPDTDLSGFNLNDPVIVNGCTVSGGANNRTGTIAALDDAGDWIELDINGGVSTTVDTCMLVTYNNDGPKSFDGVDAFVSANVQGSEYLIFGGHNETAGITEIHYTTDLDSQLDNQYCNISPVTIGNTKSLQNIFGYEDYLYIAFATDHAQEKPLLAKFQLSPTCVVDTTSDDVMDSGQSNKHEIKYLDHLGRQGTPENTATNQGIDSMTVFENRFFIANNGGVASTANIPLTSASLWDQIRSNADFGGTAQELPGIGQLRPGEKSMPFMTKWGTSLFVARNRNDGFAEVWKYKANTWTKVVDTSSAVGSMNPNNSDVSVLIVNGTRLYIGFDNITNGAELWRTADGIADNNFDGQDDLVKVGFSGLGPSSAGVTALQKNAQFMSSASVSFDGNDYLYLTVGCNSDFLDQGLCDRDSSPDNTNFAIRLFRQID